MKHIILFEKDFSLREEISQVLNEKELDFSASYSLAKLEHLKQKFNKEKKEVLLFINRQDVEVEKAEELFHDIAYFERDTFKDDLLKMLSDAKKGTYRESRLGKYKHDLICIGSSTGGLPIVQKILKGIELKETTVIICQHVNQQHNSNIMEALERSIKGKYLQVDESTKLKKGFVYILAGGSDYEIKKRYNDYYIDPVGLSDEQYHPSFNVLTKSLIPLNEMNTGCMILSGLGNDGSKYLSELKNNNVKLLVQEPESAVAPYMPKAAIATGKIDHVYNESDLSDYLKRSAA